MRPSDALLALAKEVVHDCWKQKKGEFNRQLADCDKEKKELDVNVEKLTSLLLDTDDAIMVEVFKERLKETHIKRQHLAVRSRQMYSIDTSIEDALGTVFDFIGNPLGMWANGDLEDKRLVLKLAFAKQLPYSAKEGFGTALTSLPFRVFQEMSAGKVKMVEGEGFEPSNS